MISLFQSARRTGFTLVEIMIVVAIIALLAAISVPYLLKSREYTQAALVKNDMHQINSALQEAATEKNLSATASVTGDEVATYLDPHSNLAKNLAGVGAGGNVQSSMPGVTIKLPVMAKDPVTAALNGAFGDPSDVPTAYFSPFTVTP